MGMMTASALKAPYFDFDDYIFRSDAKEPFTERYSQEEKIGRLLSAIEPNPLFVLAGYMDGDHEELDRLFSIAFHITAPKETREARIRKRDLEIYGSRVMPGGDMFENHERFIQSVSLYEDPAKMFLKRHREWAGSLDCPVIPLDGSRPLSENLQLVLNECRKVL